LFGVVGASLKCEVSFACVVERKVGLEIKASQNAEMAICGCACGVACMELKRTKDEENRKIQSKGEGDGRAGKIRNKQEDVRGGLTA
jgi:hypothetical protein